MNIKLNSLFYFSDNIYSIIYKIIINRLNITENSLWLIVTYDMDKPSSFNVWSEVNWIIYYFCLRNFISMKKTESLFNEDLHFWLINFYFLNQPRKLKSIYDNFAICFDKKILNIIYFAVDLMLKRGRFLNFCLLNAKKNWRSSFLISFLNI